MERHAKNAIAIVRRNEPSPHDPSAKCDSCGAEGTVARVTRGEANPTTSRYCRVCWPQVRAQLAARNVFDELLLQSDPRAWVEWKAQREGALWFETLAQEPVVWSSRAWSDVVEFLDLVTHGPASDPRMLRELAAEIRAHSPDMDGPMPDEVKAFLRDVDGPAV